LIPEFFLPTRQACEAGGNGEGVRKKRGEQSTIQCDMAAVKAQSARLVKVNKRKATLNL